MATWKNWIPQYYLISGGSCGCGIAVLGFLVPERRSLDWFHSVLWAGPIQWSY